MKRAAAAAAGAAAALALAAPALGSERHPRLSEFEDSVMCPVCAGETLAMSSSPAARQVERFIRRRIAAGDTRSEIDRRLVAEYGPGILAAPPRHGWNLLAWLLPLVGIVVAAVAIGAGVWRWSRVRDGGVAGPDGGAEPDGRLDPELERRLDDALARFE